MKVEDLRIVIFILVLAFIFRFVVFLFSHYAIAPDSVPYIEASEQISQGNLKEFNVKRAPVYPLLISIASPIFKDRQTAGVAISLIFSVLLILPLFYIARDIFRREGAIISSLLAACYPWLVYYSFSVLAEATYITMVTLAIASGWLAWKRGQSRYFALTGLLCSLCYLTRNEGLGYGLFMLPLAFFSGVITGKDKKLNLINALVFLVAFLAISFPYLLFLHWKLGEWTVSYYFWNITGAAYNPSGFGTPDFFLSLKTFLIKYFRNLRDLLTGGISTLLPAPFLVLAGIGLCHKNEVRDDVFKKLFLIYFIFPPFLIVPIGQAIYHRYIFSSLPLLLILLGGGICQIQSWFKQNMDVRDSRFKKSLSYFPLVVVLAIFTAISIVPTIKIPLGLLPTYEIEYEEAGKWMKKNLPDDAIILCNIGLPAFHSGKEGVSIRIKGKPSLSETMDLKEIILLAKDLGRRSFLVVQERWKPENLGHLLDSSNAPKELKHIYTLDKYPQAKVVVYELQAG